MLTLIIGAPGTGKSSALVGMLLQEQREREKAKEPLRVVYAANIPDLQIPHDDLADPLKWPAVVPDGAIMVVDECHEFWPVRAAGSKVPESVAAMATHRHRGIDIYLVAQHAKQIDQGIRALCGRLVYLEDLGVLGRRWFEWNKCPDSINPKTAPINVSYKLDKETFGLYKSASVHIKPRRKFPPWLWWGAAALVLFVGALFYAVPFLWRFTHGGLVETKAAKPAAPGASAAAAPGGVNTAAAPPAAAASGALDLARVYPAAVPHLEVQFRGQHMPYAWAGCYSMGADCYCYSRGPFPIKFRPVVSACLAVANGEVGPHPDLPLPGPVVQPGGAPVGAPPTVGTGGVVASAGGV